jgi:molecular chaperone HtpG
VTSGPSFEGKPFKSVSQGGADLAAIPLLDAEQEAPIADGATTDFHRFHRGDAWGGGDRQLERLLAGAGRITTAAKPILEVNSRHSLIVSLASLGEREGLLDEARVLDGERPADTRGFSDRSARVLGRGLRTSG